MAEYRKLCVTAVALLLAACGVAPVARAPDGTTPVIELRPGTPGEWSATYTLAAPATALRFTRKPTLFASLAPHAPSDGGLHVQGGVLPGQVFMHLYSGEWSKATEQKVVGFLPWFFAHEAAHLFQHAGESRTTHDQQAWIHEGGADAFAALSSADFCLALATQAQAQAQAQADPEPYLRAQLARAGVKLRRT